MANSHTSPPENIYPLTEDNIPDELDADPYGNLLFFSPIHGWMVAAHDEIPEILRENGCTHWTYTPPLPKDVLNHPH